MILESANSGKVEAGNLKRLLNRIHMKPVKGIVLEYSCGVGRVTRWLSDMFPAVIGVAISENHRALANKYFREEGLTNVGTIKISNVQDIENLPDFDFLYSKIVLRHNPPPVMYKVTL